MGRIVAVVLVIAGVVTTRESAGAYQSAAPLQFEVASVKENNSGERRMSRRFLPGGRVEIRNMPLKVLIGFAYGIDIGTEAFRVSGGNSSVIERRFDIDAVAPAGSSPTSEELVTMLRTLLTTRFFLKTRSEIRPERVYALTVAEKGKLGPALRASKYNCGEWAGSGLDTEPRDENGRGLCGPTQRDVIAGGFRRRYAGTMAMLAQMLPVVAPELNDRLVVDMTGLTGSYQWEFTYAQIGAADALTHNLPSVFVAFREQLGLKLEPQTAPIEVLVIESVTLPSPN